MFFRYLKSSSLWWCTNLLFLFCKWYSLNIDWQIIWLALLRIVWILSPLSLFLLFILFQPHFHLPILFLLIGQFSFVFIPKLINLIDQPLLSFIIRILSDIDCFLYCFFVKTILACLSFQILLITIVNWILFYLGVIFLRIFPLWKFSSNRWLRLRFYESNLCLSLNFIFLTISCIKFDFWLKGLLFFNFWRLALARALECFMLIVNCLGSKKNICLHLLFIILLGNLFNLGLYLLCDIYSHLILYETLNLRQYQV